MPTVETLRGPVDTASLGFTLMHEHVFVLSQGVPENFPSTFDEEAAIKEAQQKLKDVASAGVQTFVDLTVLGIGRNVPRVLRAAEGVPLNIIVATGLYTFDEVPRYFPPRGTDHMAGLFVKDIEEGIQGTNVKAAILKCATDEQGVTRGVEMVLRAVARAHRLTGVPISTHTHPGSGRGLEQQNVFEKEGVDLKRVVIGHSGDSEDIDYLQQIMKRGSLIGMDRFGIDLYLPTDKRVATIAKLCQLGYASQMVLSHDASCYIDFVPRDLMQQSVPNWHFRHIPDDVLPALRQSGVTDEQIRHMTVDNPRRVFEQQGSY